MLHRWGLGELDLLRRDRLREGSPAGQLTDGVDRKFPQVPKCLQTIHPSLAFDFLAKSRVGEQKGTANV
jgi:hypothetical protein